MTNSLDHPWFYLDNIPVSGEETVLSGGEARHAAGARRLEAGGRLCLFDGKGRVAVARIRLINDRGRSLALFIESVIQKNRPEIELHLASALPKGDRQGTMLDMATQIGVTSFTPLNCTNSVARSSEKSESRFQRIVTESCKQSRRAYLPHINHASTPMAVADRGDTLVFIAHPDGGSLRDVQHNTAQAGSYTVMVGPEGGFTDDEVAVSQDRGARLVSLGEGILRTETAAVVMLAHISLTMGIS